MIPNAYRMFNFDLGETAGRYPPRNRARFSPATRLRRAPPTRSTRAINFPLATSGRKIGALRPCTALTVEEEYGGSGLGYLEHCIAVEEISAGPSAAVGLSYGRAFPTFASTSCAATATKAQERRKYLPKLISGASM